MKVINVLKGDTLEGAQIGDTVINGYGDLYKIIGDYSSTCWQTLSVKYGYKTFMFKHNPNRTPIVAVEL